uniref:Uncharacterized protein n=1 Tax=Labrus bergylta TaxID=56723 RepID=A0A3Q3ECS1_9LABR
MVSSVVGFYSLRVFEILTPRKDDTTMTTIIGCCVSILVLSSALPVMSRTLGEYRCWDRARDEAWHHCSDLDVDLKR